MRFNLATPLKTRTGDTTKDARLKNAYAEVRGEQSVVRHRPSARGGVAVGTGTAQGGIGITINGTDYIYTVNGDVGALDTLATAGTSWSSGATYGFGAYASSGFSDYWAIFPTDDTNPQDPSEDSIYWSDTPSGCVTSTSYPAPRVISTTSSGPYETLPTVPDPVITVDEIVPRYCHAELHRIVETVYSLRTVTGQYKQALSGTIFGGGSGVLPVVSTAFVHTYYGASAAACEAQATAAALGIFPASPTWSAHPTWTFSLNAGLSTYLSSYHNYTDSEGPPGYVTGLYGYGGSNTITQLTLYYIDEETTEYYEVQ